MGENFKFKPQLKVWIFQDLLTFYSDTHLRNTMTRFCTKDNTNALKWQKNSLR